MQEVTSNEAGNRIKTRGYCIIKSACLHIDLIFTLRFLVFPGLEKNQDLQNEKEQVEQTKQEVQDTIKQKSIVEKKIVKQKQSLWMLRRDFMICLRISRSMTGDRNCVKAQFKTSVS